MKLRATRSKSIAMSHFNTLPYLYFVLFGRFSEILTLVHEKAEQNSYVFLERDFLRFKLFFF